MQEFATEFFVNYIAITPYCKTDVPLFSYVFVLIQTFPADTSMPFMPTVGETQGFSPPSQNYGH